MNDERMERAKAHVRVIIETVIEWTKIVLAIVLVVVFAIWDTLVSLWQNQLEPRWRVATQKQKGVIIGGAVILVLAFMLWPDSPKSHVSVAKKAKQQQQDLSKASIEAVGGYDLGILEDVYDVQYSQPSCYQTGGYEQRCTMRQRWTALTDSKMSFDQDETEKMLIKHGVKASRQELAAVTLLLGGLSSGFWGCSGSSLDMTIRKGTKLYIDYEIRFNKRNDQWVVTSYKDKTVGCGH